MAKPFAKLFLTKQTTTAPGIRVSTTAAPNKPHLIPSAPIPTVQEQI